MSHTFDLFSSLFPANFAVVCYSSWSIKLPRSAYLRWKDRNQANNLILAEAIFGRVCYRATPRVIRLRRRPYTLVCLLYTRACEVLQKTKAKTSSQAMFGLGQSGFSTGMTVKLPRVSHIIGFYKD